MMLVTVRKLRSNLPFISHGIEAKQMGIAAEVPPVNFAKGLMHGAEIVMREWLAYCESIVFPCGRPKHFKHFSIAFLCRLCPFCFSLVVHRFSFSGVQAFTRRRFLSRETGLPGKGLRMKRKIPYSLDKANYTHFPIRVNSEKVTGYRVIEDLWHALKS